MSAPCSRCGKPTGVVGPGEGVEVLCGTCPPSLVGGEGWKKGVIDCIDVLYARQMNGGGDFSKAIEHLQALFARDRK